jgi:hypothetical protein
VVLRKTWQPMDSDAAAYITAVETADGQALEEKTKIAIDNFVLGCKADGIWSAIKASCILAGARTLTGALVPLAGTAPTNNNFVSGDYNRKTGLAGNGSTKRLNSNRSNNADPQNSKHVAVYYATVSTLFALGAGGSTGRSGITDTTAFLNSATSTTLGGTPANNSFVGLSRASASTFTRRVNQQTNIASSTSETPSADDIFLFSRNIADTLTFFTTSRLAFYSIGEALDLARLDSRVTDLINAFGAAIP